MLQSNCFTSPKTWPLRISCMYVHHIIMLLDKGIMCWQVTWQPYIPLGHVRKGKSCTLIKVQNWIFRHSIRYLHSKSVLTNNVTLLGLPTILSAVKTGFQSYYDITYPRGWVSQRWFLNIAKDLHTKALKQVIYLPFIKLFPILS